MALKRPQRLREDRMIRLANGAYKLPAGAAVVRVEKKGRQLLYVLDGSYVSCITSTGEIPIPDALQGLIRQRYFE